MDLNWGQNPGLPRWAQWNHRDPLKREAGKSKEGANVVMEATSVGSESERKMLGHCSEDAGRGHEPRNAGKLQKLERVRTHQFHFPRLPLEPPAGASYTTCSPMNLISDFKPPYWWSLLQPLETHTGTKCPLRVSWRLSHNSLARRVVPALLFHRRGNRHREQLASQPRAHRG